jgi:hypothetical protein
MTIRMTLLAFAGAGALASVWAPLAQAQADDWHLVTAYRSLAACQGTGQSLVSRRQARAFRCENDYDKAGVPVLDLYTR